MISAQVSDLQASESRIINLFKGASLSTPATTSLPSNLDWNFELEAKVYTQQTTLVAFGNSSGHTPGTAFLEGEVIRLRLTGPSTEEFKLVVTKALAGGGWETLTKIAEAFKTLINTQSQVYVGSKTGEGGGYEKLWVTTKSPAAGAFQLQFLYGGQATLTQKNLSNYAPPQILVAKPQLQLQQQVNLNGKKRLDGVVAREFTIVTPFKNTVTNTEHSQLTARLHTRLYENGQRIRTEAVIENNWAYNPNPGNITYEVVFKQGGQTIHEQPIFTHYHHARWRKIIWKGAEPKVSVRHHMPYFMSSKAVWNYDLNLKVPETVLANEGARLAATKKGPMGGAFISNYFPMTGGREEIGPLPRWTALFLVTQDERARASMLANAEAAASIPMHYRDAVTDQPLDLDRHPGVAVRLGQSTAADKLPAVVESLTPWTVDISHQGSFAYVPYLVTGDHFFLDEIMFWASWNMAANNPSFRGFGEGLIYSEQVRGQAWGLRSIGEAALVLPDNHEMKTYFKTRLNNNLVYYVNKFPRNTTPGAVSPMGSIEKPDEYGKTGPWQNDLMGLVVSQLAENGEPLAQEFLAWISKFNVGRFQNEANGYCLAKAPAYYINIRDTSGAFINSWSQLFQRNWPGLTCSDSLAIDPSSYPTTAIGYAAYARAMLAAAHNAQIPGAKAAYSTWVAKTPAIDGAMVSDPTWAIIPRQ